VHIATIIYLTGILPTRDVVSVEFHAFAINCHEETQVAPEYRPILICWPKLPILAHFSQYCPLWGQYWQYWANIGRYLPATLKLLTRNHRFSSENALKATYTSVEFSNFYGCNYNGCKILSTVCPVERDSTVNGHISITVCLRNRNKLYIAI